MTTPLIVRVSSALVYLEERVVISLEQPAVGGDAVLFTGSEAELADLTVNPLGADAVARAGRFVFDQLQAHPELQVELAPFGTDAGQTREIYVLVRGEGLVETVPWEILCAPNGEFLALDARWPFGRMVPSGGGGEVRNFRPPLRVAMLLSCLDIPAAQEWREVWATLSAAPFEVEVLVLVSEPDLLAEIAKLNDPRITTRPIPMDVGALQASVSAFRPQIVHLFCHGSSELIKPYVELAVATDWLREGNGPLRSLVLESDQVAKLSSAEEPAWLAILNCCEVGSPAGTVPSMARDLVNRGPFSASIAMREVVHPSDATSLSASFYPGLVSALHAVVMANGRATGIDWASLMVTPRRCLCQDHQAGRPFSMTAKATKEWTLPILYQLRTPFTARLASGAQMSTQDALTLEALRAVASQVNTLSPGIQADLAEMQAKLNDAG